MKAGCRVASARSWLPSKIRRLVFQGLQAPSAFHPEKQKRFLFVLLILSHFVVAGFTGSSGSFLPKPFCLSSGKTEEIPVYPVNPV
jgi:hypothetical protein